MPRARHGTTTLLLLLLLLLLLESGKWRAAEEVRGLRHMDAWMVYGGAWGAPWGTERRPVLVDGPRRRAPCRLPTHPSTAISISIHILNFRLQTEFKQGKARAPYGEPPPPEFPPFRRPLHSGYTPRWDPAVGLPGAREGPPHVCTCTRTFRVR